MLPTPSANTLFYGDNLNILREHIADETVDLIYLDPPFNSNANYNVLFRAPGGEQSQSQIEAFEDTWHWNVSAERAFSEVLQSGNSDAANMLVAMRSFLGTNDMMAYLAMMAVRLIELHRVLKPTGSLYLHCDPTASHYLKLLLDAVFGPKQFRAEIIWKRTNARGTRGKWPRLHDTILQFSKTNSFGQNVLTVVADANKLPHTPITGSDGQKYQTYELTGAGTRSGETGQPWRGFDPTSYGRHWGNLHAHLDDLDQKGQIHWPKNKGFPRRLADQPFEPGNRTTTVGDVWTDVDRINQSAGERLGYPTQKPLALMERILAASSNPGDLVLDPFCGCGTTVHAAQKLDRRWIGIDVTHLAVGLIQRRLRDAFPMADFQVLGTTRDIGAARALAEADKHQFQLWALSMIENGVPCKGGRKGADGGVDGYVYFQTRDNFDDGGSGGLKTGKAIVSIKGGGVTDSHVKDLITTIDHESAQMGLFVTLLPPTKPMIARAAAAGFYEAGGRTYPKVQILTIEQMFDGKRPDMPWLDPSVFRKAKRETKPTGQGELL